MTGNAVETHDVVIVGAGPAGLAAARQLIERGVTDVVVLEREREAGGIPRHCHHTGYGLREFGRLMKGPAFARRTVAAAERASIRTGVTVTTVEPGGILQIATPSGTGRIRGRRVLFALGVRETPRPPRLISGTRPWGVTTTGALQQFIYLSGLRPFRRAVIIGSELVSFSALLTMRSGGIETAAMIEENARITARRPADLMARFLLGVPVLTSTRLVSIEGAGQVEGVTIERNGTQSQISCDGVVFSGRFRPESAILQPSHLQIDSGSGGPVVDQYGRCSDPAYFASGNMIHPVETAGRCYREGLQTGQFIARDLEGRLAPADQVLKVETRGALSYLCPQVVALPEIGNGTWSFTARVSREVRGRISVSADGSELWSRSIHALPERRITIPSQVILRNDLKTLTVQLVGAGEKPDGRRSV